MRSERELLLIVKAVTDEEMETLKNGIPNCGSSKWERITNRLPKLLRKKSTCGYMCQHAFKDLLQAFRGRRKCRKLTKPIQELLTKRDDFLSSYGLTTLDLRGGFKGQRKNIRLAKPIQTTHLDRILLIKTVMQVEKEIRNCGTTGPVRRSSKKERILGKWGRIASLLPPRLSQMRVNGTYRCKGIFTNMLQAYKAEKNGHNNHSHGTLSNSVRKLLKRRDDIINAATSAQSQNSENPGSQYLSEQSNVSHASTEVPSHFLNKVDAEEKLPADSNERNYAVSSLGRASPSLGEPREYTEGGLNNPPWSPQTPSSPRSLHEAWTNDDVKTAQVSAQPGVQARSFLRKKIERSSSPGPLSNENSRGFTSMRNTTTSMAHASDEEHNHDALLDGSLRKIDREFSDLSSWLHCQSIPVAKTMLRGSISSGKRRKLNTATEPFDDLIQENLFKRMDHQVRAVFESLKIRFSKELKNAVVELAEAVLPGAN